MKPKVAVLLTQGFEELEAITVIDVLRRAGCELRIVAVDGGGEVSSSHGVRIGSDCSLAEVDARGLDMIVCPGGMPGAEHLAESAPVRAALQAVHDNGGWACAVCAGPLALHAAGLLEGRRFTVYPGFENQITGGQWTGEDVESDGRVVTSRGPGTALAFAYRLLECLDMAEKASVLRKGMLAE